ncbi:MAG: apolipoprotein N-acyltransferase [Verrucomicrobiota bacterium]
MTLTPWQARAAAARSGLLLAVAFPPVNAWPLALVALIPLLLAVWPPLKNRSYTAYRTHRAYDSDFPEPEPAGGQTAAAPPAGFWRGFRLGWIFGLVFFTGTMWWVQYVSFPGMVALCLYLALYPAVAGGVMAWLGIRSTDRWSAALGKVALMAGVWCGLEWVRSVALSGFPWNGLAVPLFPLAGMRHLAAGTGVIGLSAVVLLPALMAAACFRLAGRQRIILLILLVLGLAGGGVLEFSARVEDALATRKPRPADSLLTALLVQPNVSMEDKMSPDPEIQRRRDFDLMDQTDAALAAGRARVDLVVWPESAISGFFHDALGDGAFAPQLDQGDFTLVTGADSQEWGELHNSVAALRQTPDNHLLHDKVCLVPFGEFIPFRREIPLLEKMIGHLIPYDFTPGQSLEPLKPAGQPFSIVPLICFEDTIGRHARKFIRPEPQVLVNVTNDNWFLESPATEIHFANARWRAPELRRTLLRSANTGVTASVSPEGIVERLPSFRKGVLTAAFGTGDGGITFYARHGDLFSQTAGLMAVLGCGVIWGSRRPGLKKG